MKLIRAATLSVADLDRAVDNYCEWLDYSVEEQGELDAGLAASWDSPWRHPGDATPYCARHRAGIYSFASSRTGFTPITCRCGLMAGTPSRSASKTCWQANERMLGSPFEIIGPPKELDGLPAIYPMQVKGPDQEIVYLTQIREDLPAFDLPRAEALIDRLFILVMGCSDMAASLKWLEDHVDFAIGRDRMEIVYTMLANAFDLPVEEEHVISTMVHEKDVFLELDQYPPQATVRPHYDGELPQGVASGTFLHPDFDALNARCEGSLDHVARRLRVLHLRRQTRGDAACPRWHARGDGRGLIQSSSSSGSA